MVSTVMICYTNTACNNDEAVSDTYTPVAMSLNARSVMGMQTMANQPRVSVN